MEQFLDEINVCALLWVTGALQVHQGQQHMVACGLDAQALDGEKVLKRLFVVDMCLDGFRGQTARARDRVGGPLAAHRSRDRVRQFRRHG